jgi:hypothetical protein
MHGNAIRHFVEGREQASHFIRALLTQDMQTPRAVFPAAPRQKNALHRRIQTSAVPIRDIRDNP